MHHATLNKFMGKKILSGELRSSGDDKFKRRALISVGSRYIKHKNACLDGKSFVRHYVTLHNVEQNIIRHQSVYLLSVGYERILIVK